MLCYLSIPLHNGHCFTAASFQCTQEADGEVQMYDIPQVKNTSQLWTWLEGVFIPVVYAGKWYNGQRETTTEYTGDKRSILVGMPRLRQLRVMKGNDR